MKKVTFVNIDESNRKGERYSTIEQVFIRLAESNTPVIWMSDMDVMDYLKISRSTLSRMIKGNKIIWIYVGKRKAYARQIIDYQLINNQLIL